MRIRDLLLEVINTLPDKSFTNQEVLDKLKETHPDFKIQQVQKGLSELYASTLIIQTSPLCKGHRVIWERIKK